MKNKVGELLGAERRGNKGMGSALLHSFLLKSIVTSLQSYTLAPPPLCPPTTSSAASTPSRTPPALLPPATQGFSS